MQEPAQLTALRELIGLSEDHDNPKVVALARFVGETFPDMRAYAATYTSPTQQAWCGVAQAYAAAKAGYRPPFGPTDFDKWMWAQSWKQLGTAVVGAPQLGDIMVLPRHVTMYAGMRDGRYIGLGGNQGDSIKESLYSPDAIESIRRPPQAAQIGTEPDKPAAPFVALDQLTIDAITTAAAASDLAQYSWRDRGRAPIGYIKGTAVTFGMALRKLAARDSAALAMVRVVDGPGDVFDYYDLGTLGAPDVDRLRALWVVLTGLGMRESSGNYSEGRDMSASNTSADTAEAGLFQMSWNAHTTSPEIPKLLDAYAAGKYPGFKQIFSEGVRAKDTDNVGDGLGVEFQLVAKMSPAFAVEVAAIGLRTLYTHWGPIIRHEAEILPAADALFRQVQEIVNVIPVTKGKPVMTEPTTDQSQATPSSPVSSQLIPSPAGMAKPDVKALLNYIFVTNGDEVGQFGKLVFGAIKVAHPNLNFSPPGTASPAPAVSAPPATIGSEHFGIGGLIGTLLMQSANLVGPAIGSNATTTGSLLTMLFGGLASAGTVAKIGPSVKAAIGVLAKILAIIPK